MNQTYLDTESPVGRLRLVAESSVLIAVLWENDPCDRVRLDTPVESSGSPSERVLVAAKRQLDEYFVGQRILFDLPFALRGTPFQKQVWNALLAIPYGQTRTYGQLADQIGNPKAVRAVGAANGKNPISVIVPCHRVIGASGKLTGFAGGLDAKETLLRLEANECFEGANRSSYATNGVQSARITR